MPITNCILIGAPVDSGKRRPGCLMGPDAYRTAGLATALRDLGPDCVNHPDLCGTHETRGEGGVKWIRAGTDQTGALNSGRFATGILTASCASSWSAASTPAVGRWQ